MEWTILALYLLGAINAYTLVTYVYRIDRLIGKGVKGATPELEKTAAFAASLIWPIIAFWGVIKTAFKRSK